MHFALVFKGQIIFLEALENRCGSLHVFTIEELLKGGERRVAPGEATASPCVHIPVKPCSWVFPPDRSVGV